MFLGLSIAIFVFLADQISKYWVANVLLEDILFVRYSSFFNLVRAKNTGVSFSMFSGQGYTGVVVLSVAALIIVAFLLHWLFKEKNKYMQIALGMIVGGALGNVVDRIRTGAVFDFLDFHLGQNHWPAFNVADSFICIGAVLLIILSFMVKTEKEN